MSRCDVLDLSNNADETLLKLDRIDAVLSVLFSDSFSLDPDYMKDQKNQCARERFVDNYNTLFTMTHIISDYVDSVRKDLNNISSDAAEIDSRIRAAKASL